MHRSQRLRRTEGLLSDFQEIKNIALHELGHAHMLQHSHDLDVSNTNNNLMFHSLTGVSTASIKTNDATGANIVFTNSQNLLENSDCITPISQGGCGDVNSLDNILSSDLITLSPNPNTGIFSLSVSHELHGEAEWYIQDITGKHIFSGKGTLDDQQINIDIEETISTGTYIFSLFTEKGVVTKKLIIYE